MSDSQRNKSPKKCSIQLSDDAVRDSLYARGFYDSWITPELIVAERKVLAARRQHPPKTSRHLLEGDYD
jgi:hypothetical protein